MLQLGEARARESSVTSSKRKTAKGVGGASVLRRLEACHDEAMHYSGGAEVGPTVPPDTHRSLPDAAALFTLHTIWDTNSPTHDRARLHSNMALETTLATGNCRGTFSLQGT